MKSRDPIATQNPYPTPKRKTVDFAPSTRARKYGPLSQQAREALARTKKAMGRR